MYPSVMNNYLQLIQRSRALGVCVAGVLVSLSCAPQADAAVVSVNPIADTMIINYGADRAETYESYGSSIYLGGGIYAGSGLGEYSFLRFDLSSVLPEGAVITSATLKMTAAFTYSYSNGETLRFWQMNPANAAWTQNSGMTGTTAAYINQTSYVAPGDSAGAAWASGGIFNVIPGDLGNQIGQQSLTGVDENVTYSFSLDAATVNSWLTDSVLANAGLVFHMTNDENPAAASRFLYFWSMNSGKGAAMLPQLEVTYDAIPEPSTIGLLLLGGVAALGIRRKLRKSVSA